MNAIAPQLAIAAEPAAPDMVAAAIAGACRRIAPLWPLQRFVAVNPFLGLAERPFEEACAALRRVSGAGMVMPLEFYREALATGVVSDADLAAALAEAPPGLPTSAAGLRLALAAAAGNEPGRLAMPSVAETIDGLAEGGRHLSRATLMIDEISRWCAAWFDRGQAIWQLPGPGQGAAPWPAWRAAMRHDRTAEVAGLAGFRRAVAALPADPAAAIAAAAAALDVPPPALEDYLHRALFDIRGWAAYARHRVWESELRGRCDDVMVELLAIRTAWDYALFQLRRDERFRSAWRSAMAAAAGSDHAAPDLALRLALVLQDAYERARRRSLLAPIKDVVVPLPVRPALQAVFCIDVRSEPYRRALEAAGAEVRTLGFAGFFGLPVEYRALGAEHATPQCPVLLTPAIGVEETAPPRDVERRLARRRAAAAWRAFKLGAVSSFGFVEIAGLLHAGKLLGRTFGLGGGAAPAKSTALVVAAGLDPAQRVAAAEAMLRGMSLTHGFARLVLLAGHGSSSTNNPHAAALDCGACGGQSGGVNARIAAALLNDQAVRSELAGRGIVVPEDSWFIAGLHDTTTDALTLLDTEAVPASHAADIAQLAGWLKQASERVRAERAPTLGLAVDRKLPARLAARGRDWSQPRPEWGLAGNALFVAAPRERTRALDLGGRAFLHEYRWREDGEGKVLELIMTAPLVVASWINLQYYGSVVDNRAFGSGNKVLHNVVSMLGVLEGNGGDLRAGLPCQSLHDGRRLMHEPLRLSAVLEAPAAAIDRVLARHAQLRALLDNGWVHMFRIAGDGGLERRRRGGGWELATL
jgi:uncharacterized protein YbcC (UPF0753/DUF2309 family)